MNPVTVDPRISFWLSIGLGVAGFIGSSGALLADTGADPITVKHFLAWLTLGVGVGNIINAALAAIPGKDPTSGKFYINKVIAPSDKPTDKP